MLPASKFENHWWYSAEYGAIHTSEFVQSAPGHFGADDHNGVVRSSRQISTQSSGSMISHTCSKVHPRTCWCGTIAYGMYIGRTAGLHIGSSHGFHIRHSSSRSQKLHKHVQSRSPGPHGYYRIGYVPKSST
jgi:hypothetical protein